MTDILKRPWDLVENQNSDLNIQAGQVVELVVLAVKRTGIRCRLLNGCQPVTFRLVREEVEGEIITVEVIKIWRYKTTDYMTGSVLSSRIDIPALKLTPLGIKDQGEWDPAGEDLFDNGDPFEKYYAPIIVRGPRKSYEMEQVIPFQDPDDDWSDPIIEAADCHDRGDYEKAHEIMEHILTTDLRCIDAHAHLGNWDSDGSTFRLERAKRHYQVGIKIAELSFGNEFEGLLPWGHINNRPFLRCMHGYGLVLWKLGEIQEAKQVFDKMLWLNPSDNQGARFLLADIESGKSLNELEDDYKRMDEKKNNHVV